MNFNIAVKSFIVKNNKFLAIKRRDNDVQKPGMWEIPGGRLKPGEDPILGLKRETKEETGIDIKILAPLTVRHFTRNDGQRITMLSFVCKPISNKIKLSKEHTAYEWMNIDRPSKLGKFFLEEVKAYKKLKNYQ